MNEWKPIKKVAAGFVAAGLAYLARQLGVDLGSDEINEAALSIVGILTAYLVKS